MTGALPLPLTAVLAVVGVLLPAGTWHAGVPEAIAHASVDPAAAGIDAFAGPSGPALEHSIVGGGQDSRGATPGSAPEEGSVEAPEDRRPVELAAVIATGSAGDDAVWARAPPAAGGALPA